MAEQTGFPLPHNIFKFMFLWEMREMVGYAQDNNGHADLQKARITRDKKDVQEMTDLLFSSWLNPFSDESQPLAYCIRD